MRSDSGNPRLAIHPDALDVGAGVAEAGRSGRRNTAIALGALLFDLPIQRVVPGDSSAMFFGLMLGDAGYGHYEVSNWARDGGAKPRSAETLANISCHPG